MRFAILLLLWPLLARTERILVLNQPISVSHVRLLHTIIKELQKRGHEVTELAWPVTDSVLERRAPEGVRSLRFNSGVGSQRALLLQSYIDEWAWMQQDTLWDVFSLFIRHTIVNLDFKSLLDRWFTVGKLLIEPCLELLEDQQLQQTLREGNFTLAIIDSMAHACSWVTVNELKIPYLLVSNFMEHYQLNLAAGIACPFSYVPATMDPKPMEMGFFSRLTNSFQHYTFELLHRGLLIYARLLAGPGARWFEDTELHADVHLINAQRFLDDYPRPLALTLHTFNIANGVVQQQLTQEIDNFVNDDSSLGTVILSMSTTTSSALMGAGVQRAFIDAFVRFPKYRFIWRMDESISGLNHTHSNIRTWSWIPQRALLEHNKTRLLITHGGINSILEAMNHAIPMLVVPLFGDQYPNSARIQQHGLGRVLWKNKISPDEVEKQLRLILSAPGSVARPRTTWFCSHSFSYSDRLEKICSMMHTQHLLPNLRDSHIFWIEFTARHPSQMHRLKPKGSLLSHTCYFGFDIVVPVTFTFLFVITLLSTN